VTFAFNDGFMNTIILWTVTSVLGKEGSQNFILWS